MPVDQNARGSSTSQPVIRGTQRAHPRRHRRVMLPTARDVSLWLEAVQRSIRGSDTTAFDSEDTALTARPKWPTGMAARARQLMGPLPDMEPRPNDVKTTTAGSTAMMVFKTGLCCRLPPVNSTDSVRSRLVGGVGRLMGRGR
jgi:hypothetical protein